MGHAVAQASELGATKWIDQILIRHLTNGIDLKVGIGRSRTDSGKEEIAERQWESYLKINLDHDL